MGATMLTPAAVHAHVRRRIGVAAAVTWHWADVTLKVSVAERKLAVCVTGDDRALPDARQRGEVLSGVWQREIESRSRQIGAALYELGADGVWRIGVLLDGVALPALRRDKEPERSFIEVDLGEYAPAPEPEATEEPLCDDNANRFAAVAALLAQPSPALERRWGA